MGNANLQLTYRDRALMRWINSVGTVTIDHVTQWMCVAQSTAYGRLGKLVKYQYLKYDEHIMEIDAAATTIEHNKAQNILGGIRYAF